jgi:5-methylcytosine-specific restriction endonuclease McrA
MTIEKFCPHCKAVVPMDHRHPNRRRGGATLEGRPWRTLRAKVLAQAVTGRTADGKPRCAYCQAAAVTVDHVIPVAQGGTDAIENLVPSCEYHNKAKGWERPRC